MKSAEKDFHFLESVHRHSIGTLYIHNKPIVDPN